VSTVAPEDDSTATLVKYRISAFVLPRGLITVRLPAVGPDGAAPFDIDLVSQRFDELGGQEHGTGARVHGLLDVVVDGHFEAVQELDDAIESLEDELFDNDGPRRGLQRRTYRMRKDLVQLRRVVLPMREVVSTIQHRRLDSRTSPELDPLYADLYDHVLRASEWTESLRDMVTSVFETNLSLQDARLNTVMKKLTGWAAIIAVPTAITGFYGDQHHDRIRRQFHADRRSGDSAVRIVQEARLAVNIRSPLQGGPRKRALRMRNSCMPTNRPHFPRTDLSR
jgi:magnesium transporter